MPKFKTSYLVMALSFVGTLMLLFAGFYVYQYLGFTKPLTEAIAYDLNINIDNITIDKKEKSIAIEHQTDNLMGDYHKAQTIVQQYQGATEYGIQFVDKRDEQINQTYEALSFHLYEILETKRYTEFNNLQQHLQIPADLQIEIDDKFIYLNLKNGEHYLYEILPRNQMMG